MRQHGQEAVARDGRQRALHRLRLCRPRTGHPRLHGLKVPERGSDVRQRQPRPRAGGHPRRVRGQAGQGHGGADRRRQREGRQRLSGERWRIRQWKGHKQSNRNAVKTKKAACQTVQPSHWAVFVLTKVDQVLGLWVIRFRERVSLIWYVPKETNGISNEKSTSFSEPSEPSELLSLATRNFRKMCYPNHSILSLSETQNPNKEAKNSRIYPTGSSHQQAAVRQSRQSGGQRQEERGESGDWWGNYQKGSINQTIIFKANFVLASNLRQTLSVTVILLGNRKSVTVSDCICPMICVIRKSFLGHKTVTVAGFSL